MEPFFPEKSYDTRDDLPRRLMDRLSFNTRWYFVAGYVREIVRSRSLALKGRYDTKAWAESSYNIFKLVESCGGRFHLRGLDNLRHHHGPIVFISNHMSTLETFVFPCIIAPLMEVTFIVKESLVNHPLFGPVMCSRKPIVVGRNNPREDFKIVMEMGKKLLSEGKSMIVFPQSTRNIEFIPGEFNSLGIKLAKATGAQVIPVAIKTDFWGNGRLLKDVGPVDRSQPINMVFGRPFTIGKSGKEEHKQVVDFIIEHLTMWDMPVKGSRAERED
ncbi:MAG: 1-acyl-sn-glycerol-3-phosphate acyltransferase [Firmicutes bacterium HGW-Firmicutes-14]|nr:MAG: 1-acyl-sn-glycerol-3-phosphate acyltransferase [Firmicutes bacterium HGW-Firmicutes-14]